MADAGSDNHDNIDQMEEGDVEYFQSYESLDVHRLMLQDRPRTMAYKQYIEKNKDLFSGKLVVDVGAGTGILSLFAARAGAKQVYSIEASSMSQACQEIVEVNSYSDVITVLHGKAEDVSLPGDVKADILISEWMGFYLLHESMLDSVIVARDKFLKSDGIMLPSSASLYLCPVSVPAYWSEHLDFWHDVYGFDFTPLQPAAQMNVLSQPAIIQVEPSQCLAEPKLVTHLELQYVAQEDLYKIISMFKFNICKNAVLHGFACWFSAGFDEGDAVMLDTGPEAASTHWKQTVILLPSPLLVSVGEQVECGLELEQDPENKRRYNISVDVKDEEDDADDDDGATEDEGATDMMSDDVREAIFKVMKH